MLWKRNSEPKDHALSFMVYNLFSSAVRLLFIQEADVLGLLHPEWSPVT